MKDKVFIDTNILIYAYSAAAPGAQCSILYSEDMQHNQLIEDKPEIINPFKLLTRVSEYPSPPVINDKTDIE